MEILIKGMEMPDSCFLCRFCRRQEHGEYVGEDTAWSCVASKKRITDGQDLIVTFKHPDCPLVEAAEVQDAVSRQQAIDARRYTFGNDEFSLEAAYHDCKLVFDGITDDDSFQEADTGLVLYYANEIIYALQEALKAQDVPDTNVGDINKFIDGLEEIFADLRERRVDDSVCGLCEYDGAYIGQSGDWCNECPGFDRDDCFKLSDRIRKKWIDEITKSVPSAQPQKRTDKRTETHACDLIKRQDAIDIMVFECGKWTGLAKEISKQLRQLPSAQPDRDALEMAYAHGETAAEARYYEMLPKWIPVTKDTLPIKGKVVIVKGKTGTWDFGTYRGYSHVMGEGDIHLWNWKKNTLKRVYWWMYKDGALPGPTGGEQE